MEPRSSGAWRHHIFVSADPPNSQPSTSPARHSPARSPAYAEAPKERRPRIRRALAPQLRGRVTPEILEGFRALGFTVHVIGAAAYAHRDGKLGPEHFIFGVWPKHGEAPTWSVRLGLPSAGYLRRVDRRSLEQSFRSLARDARGRFEKLLAWWQRPTVGAYAFEGVQASAWDQYVARVDERNREIRIARSLEWPDEPELVLRALAGDR